MTVSYLRWVSLPHDETQSLGSSHQNEPVTLRDGPGLVA